MYPAAAGREILDEPPLACKNTSEILSLIGPAAAAERVLRLLHNFRDSSRKPVRGRRKGCS